MTADELMFFDPMPQLRPVYAELKQKTEVRCPEMSVRVSRTQIAFRNRYIFAVVSLPRRKKEEHLLVSFGLGYRRQSPRIAQAVEAAPNRWTHHVPVNGAAEIDEELLQWIEEAYRFSLLK